MTIRVLGLGDLAGSRVRMKNVLKGLGTPVKCQYRFLLRKIKIFWNFQSEIWIDPKSKFFKKLGRSNCFFIIPITIFTLLIIFPDFFRTPVHFLHAAYPLSDFLAGTGGSPFLYLYLPSYIATIKMGNVIGRGSDTINVVILTFFITIIFQLR